MRSMIPCVVVGLVVAAALPPARADVAHKRDAATVEPIPGTDVKRVVLVAKAADRLGIVTTTVRETPVAARGNGAGAAVRKVVPYASVIYDLHGETWVYTNPEPLVFIRQHLRVDFIDGDLAVLSNGPAVGTAVVTVGAAELFGIEFDIGK